MKLSHLLSIAAVVVGCAAPTFAQADWHPRVSDRVEARAVSRNAHPYDLNHDGRVATREIRAARQAELREQRQRQFARARAHAHAHARYDLRDHGRAYYR